MVYGHLANEHPVEETGRLLAAALLKHLSLSGTMAQLLEQENNLSNVPKSIADLIRSVHQTKWNLIKTKQDLNRSYKEVCSPIIDKCRFLLFEMRPATSSPIQVKKCNFINF